MPAAAAAFGKSVSPNAERSPNGVEDRGTIRSPFDGESDVIHIRVSKGSNTGEELKTRKRRLSIGRGSECGLTLADPSISNVHGEVLCTAATYIYRDLLSRNGSVIRSGEQSVWLGPLMPEWNLVPGDRIVLGETVIEFVASVAGWADSCSGADQRSA
jgi:pSer/pThr/pTyr-binding forkhead associated (FHA) protein